jgi:hypothetical protein
MNDEEPDIDMGPVDRAIAALMEHYDTVQIFVTKETPGSEGFTQGIQKGGGNYYARFGHAKNWVLKQERLAEMELEDE